MSAAVAVVGTLIIGGGAITLLALLLAAWILTVSLVLIADWVRVGAWGPGFTLTEAAPELWRVDTASKSKYVGERTAAHAEARRLRRQGVPVTLYRLQWVEDQPIRDA